MVCAEWRFSCFLGNLVKSRGDHAAIVLQVRTLDIRHVILLTNNILGGRRLTKEAGAVIETVVPDGIASLSKSKNKKYPAVSAVVPAGMPGISGSSGYSQSQSIPSSCHLQD